MSVVGRGALGEGEPTSVSGRRLFEYRRDGGIESSPFLQGKSTAPL